MIEVAYSLPLPLGEGWDEGLRRGQIAFFFP
jgi:hypothetical protein